MKKPEESVTVSKVKHRHCNSVASLQCARVFHFLRVLSSWLFNCICRNWSFNPAWRRRRTQPFYCTQKLTTQVFTTANVREKVVKFQSCIPTIPRYRHPSDCINQHYDTTDDLPSKVGDVAADELLSLVEGVRCRSLLLADMRLSNLSIGELTSTEPLDTSLAPVGEEIAVGVFWELPEGTGSVGDVTVVGELLQRIDTVVI